MLNDSLTQGRMKKVNAQKLLARALNSILNSDSFKPVRSVTHHLSTFNSDIATVPHIVEAQYLLLYEMSHFGQINLENCARPKKT